jgi:mycofactocin precursor
VRFGTRCHYGSTLLGRESPLVFGTLWRYNLTLSVIIRRDAAEAGMTEHAATAAANADQATVTPAQASPAGAEPGDDALIAQELLVEEVSIDGMCGVY